MLFRSTLAKLASERAKNGSGVYVLDTAERMALGAIPLYEIWGVGRKTSEKLQKAGITTVDDARRVGKDGMHALLGVLGERLFFELSGVPSVHDIRSEGGQASIMNTRSFGTPTKSLSVVEDALTHHASSGAEKLRGLDLRATRASIMVQYDVEGARRYMTYEVVFEKPTSDTRVIVASILKIFRAHADPRHIYRKAGVTLRSFSKQGTETPSLFKTEESPHDTNSLMKVFDRVNTHFGKGTLRLGSERKRHAWSSKTAFLSPSYTTAWDALPRVKNEL